jgi:predicted O-methyltransferase YrrM
LFAADVESAVTEAECEELARLARGRIVLEIGSYYGRSTIALASTAAIVHSLDPHTGGPPDRPNTLPEFVANLERYGVRERVVVHLGLSEQVCPRFRPDAFDLIFVDAIHERPHVDRDISLAIGCLAQGGTLVFHDYGVAGARDHIGNWHVFDLTEAVDEFCDRTGAVVRQVDTLAVIPLPRRRTHSVREMSAALLSWSSRHRD